MEYIDSTGQATGAYTSEKSPDRRDVYTNAYPISKESKPYPRRRTLSPYASPEESSVPRKILAESPTYKEEISRRSDSVVENAGAVDELPATFPSSRKGVREADSSPIAFGVPTDATAANSTAIGSGADTMEIPDLKISSSARCTDESESGPEIFRYLGGL